jgi:hypothetical protein
MNVGILDRAVRIIAGVALIALAYTDTLGAWAWIGVIPLVTGIAGWCPAYKLVGINTCAIKKTAG